MLLVMTFTVVSPTEPRTVVAAFVTVVEAFPVLVSVLALVSVVVFVSVLALVSVLVLVSAEV